MATKKKYFYFVEDCLQISVKEYMNLSPNNRYAFAGFNDLRLKEKACHFGGHRYYFECPQCYKLFYKLYRKNSRDDEWGCRSCKGLTYKERQQHSKQNEKNLWQKYDEKIKQNVLKKGKKKRKRICNYLESRERIWAKYNDGVKPPIENLMKVFLQM